jgi:hypothetical protein
MGIDLHGAADLHCHFGPDPHYERSIDALDAAKEAAAAGHAAVVLKSHSYPTAALATIIRRSLPDLEVFGGVCCDYEVGGMNPAAVETSLLLGGKIVWLPTMSSKQDWDTGVGAQVGLTGPGISVLDDDGNLTAETNEIMDLIASHGAILATGHVTKEEHFAVTKAFAGRGTVLVTHAMEELAGPNLNIAECVELADLGAHIELCALTCQGYLATRAPAEIAACIDAVGADRVTLGSDFGQARNLPPAAGLQTYADALFDEGVKEADIHKMVSVNPVRVLGL